MGLDITVIPDSGVSIPYELPIGTLKSQAGTFQVLAVNLLTVVRNVVSSANNPQLTDVTEILEQVRRDIRFLNALSNGMLGVEFKLYTLNGKYYRGIHGMKNTRYREATPGTKVQLHDSIVSLTMQALAKEPQGITWIDTHPFSKDKVNKGVILTHVVMDLLECGSNVKLLESHTGALKQSPEWSSKLLIRKEDRGIIPFNYVTLNIFGDKNFVQPQLPSIKQKVYPIAEKSHWNSSTTLERVKFTLTGNSELQELINYFGM